MKIGNVTIDASDVGNGCLIIGTGVAFYGATAGNPLFAVEALAVGGALKAVASAIDNYLFKKSGSCKSSSIICFLARHGSLVGLCETPGKEKKWITAIKADVKGVLQVDLAETKFDSQLDDCITSARVWLMGF